MIQREQRDVKNPYSLPQMAAREILAIFLTNMVAAAFMTPVSRSA